ncbi:MAG: AraC family transcriptional regulator [Candidatus Accumulibacter sp.]|nr:AraC family transcriptional regulator [Accumulibacter sp.]
MTTSALSPPCTLEHWSSSETDPSLRIDYWRDVAHNWVDARPLSSPGEFDASWSLMRSSACIFGTKRSSAYEMRTDPKCVPPGEDMVVLSLLQAGNMRLNAGPGGNQHVKPGMLGLYACQQEAHYLWSENARQTYLALPRSAVTAALGREPSNVLMAQERCALAPALASQFGHLALLARRPDKVAAGEYAGMLDATRALALLTLRNLARQGDAADLPDLSESLHVGRHAAAVRFMEQNAHRHDLDAFVIAHGAGCSRTRLYEAFAARGETVMGSLREIRLQRARRLMEQDPVQHLGALSWRCGFAHQSDFTKLFKARFGMRPSEWHRQAWQGKQGR